MWQADKDTDLYATAYSEHEEMKGVEICAVAIERPVLVLECPRWQSGVGLLYREEKGKVDDMVTGSLKLHHYTRHTWSLDWGTLGRRKEEVLEATESFGGITEYKYQTQAHSSRALTSSVPSSFLVPVYHFYIISFNVRFISPPYLR